MTNWSIAIALQMWTAEGRKATSGIVDYGQEQGGFRFRDIIFSEDEEVPRKLARLRCDGAIINVARLVFAEIKEAFPADLPMVNIGDDLSDEGIGTITGVRGAGSRLLLGHLREQGYRRFAYVGPEPVDKNNPRAANLRELLTGDEGPLGVYSLPGMEEFDEKSAAIYKLGRWLKKFLAAGERTGILTYDAYRASAVITACRNLGIDVPEQIGVASYIEEQSCLTTEPAITSTENPAHELGYAAMKLLHEQLRRPRGRSQLLEVGQPILHVRGSTKPADEDQSDIAEAARFMERHLEKNIGVDDVVAHLGTMSRAKFYRAFTGQVGVSPAEYLRSLRIEHAKELLSATRISITRIAGMCGFGNLTQFGETFKRYVGQTPREYRERGKKPRRKSAASGQR